MKKPSWIMFLGMLYWVMVAYGTVHAADQAYLTANKTAPLIGEPVQVVLHLNIPQKAKIILPDFKIWGSPFFVKEVGSLTVVSGVEDGYVRYDLPVSLILWQTGQLQTPTLEVAYELDSVVTKLSVESLQFVVPSVLDPNDLSLRPFKAQINLPYFPIWTAVLGVILSMVVVLVAVRYRLVRKQRSGIPIAIDSKWHPSANVALNTLRQIGQSQVDPTVIYVQVSDCLRQYLDARFTVHFLDLTTNELLEKLEETHLIIHDHQHKLVEMLKRADLVKFARVVPQRNAAQQYASVAAQWIQSVEQMHSESPS